MWGPSKGSNSFHSLQLRCVEVFQSYQPNDVSLQGAGALIAEFRWPRQADSASEVLPRNPPSHSGAVMKPLFSSYFSLVAGTLAIQSLPMALLAVNEVYVHA